VNTLALSFACLVAALAVACSGGSSDSGASPTAAATRLPEATPTQSPAASPTSAPTQAPTAAPAAEPTLVPTSPPAQTGGGSGGGGGSSTAVVVAQALQFVNKSVTARAGDVTLVLQNKDLLVAHDIRVDGFPGSAQCTGVCETSTTFRAGPGTYRFVCTIHPDMIGTLTLTP
jgi:plastocyanin